mmetsp:Transcript_15357/g.42927  ORF Transcript_15357/g.42927 Transcript_15357/m.42927 type:complete len:588 (-) Transcript_15357:200-1963(-)|eukprot:CAMPEP_0117649852 /NCGR_PEP_ID=MMETSP0804-20121206/1216_1 /TAXON_ID=1074897 /ORGANISM="Tetraselmis astigmatica, Strain CCMP880" /LENGTH=587 /DNA_ID=CAMNT_0005455663 /DNA_START=1189 /DNA_END=2952 /DNA_ORIENTATION=+
MPHSDDQSLKFKRPGNMAFKKGSSSGSQVRRALPKPMFFVPKEPRSVLNLKANVNWTAPCLRPRRLKPAPAVDTMDEHDVAEALFSLSNMCAKASAQPSNELFPSVTAGKPGVSDAGTQDKKKRFREKPSNQDNLVPSKTALKRVRVEAKRRLDTRAGVVKSCQDGSDGGQGSLSETDHSVDTEELSKSGTHSKSSKGSLPAQSPQKLGAKATSKGKVPLSATAQSPVKGSPNASPSSSEEGGGFKRNITAPHQLPAGQDRAMSPQEVPRSSVPVEGQLGGFADTAAAPVFRTAPVPADVTAQATVPPQLRQPWKRCAAHVYIAHFIEWQQSLQASYSSANGEKCSAGSPSRNPSGPPHSDHKTGAPDRRGAAVAHHTSISAAGRGGGATSSVPAGHLPPPQYAQQLSMAQQLAVAQQLQGGFPFSFPAGLPNGFPGNPVGGPRSGLQQGSAAQFYTPSLGLGLPHLPPAGMAPATVSRLGDPGVKREEPGAAGDFASRSASQFAQLSSQDLLSKQMLERSGLPTTGHFGLPNEMHLTPEQAKILYGMALNMGGGGPQVPGGVDGRLGRGPYAQSDLAQAQGFRTKG